MTDFAYDVFFDIDVARYIWWHNGTGIALTGPSLEEARAEVLAFVDNGHFPEDLILQEGEEEVEYQHDDVDLRLIEVGVVCVDAFEYDDYGDNDLEDLGLDFDMSFDADWRDEE